MTFTASVARDSRPRTRVDVAAWAFLVLFAIVWLGSAVLTLTDLDTSREVSERIGFPGYFQLPLGILKIAGVVTVLWGRWRTLSTIAFAGFFYDLLLAGTAHAVLGESDVWLAAAAAVVTGGAFWADRRLRGR